MKTRKFNTREEITTLIDTYLQKKTKLEAQAEACDQKRKDMIQAGPGTLNDWQFSSALGFQEKEAARFRLSAANIQNKTLPALKATLAAFDTPVLPGVVADHSVMLQK